MSAYEVVLFTANTLFGGALGGLIGGYAVSRLLLRGDVRGKVAGRRAQRVVERDQQEARQVIDETRAVAGRSTARTRRRRNRRLQ